MQSHHFAGHDLDLLESYIHDCIQHLPKLPGPVDTAGMSASSTQIPTRCAAYHTVCANMLKEIMALLTLFSPRLCRLIAQVWDLVSLNLFVLLQLSHVALQDVHRLREQLAFIERFHAEDMERQTSVTQKHEEELARQRLSEQSLRAELQKIRQRANCLAVENGQLHLVVSRVLDAQATMDATRFDSSKPDGPSLCEDIAAVGAAEERELFGIDTGEDALARIETVHPIESYATDFEQLFQALFERENHNVQVLNDMDRFINSTAVALLWRYGSTEEEHQLMHKMLSASTVGTQTDGITIETPSLHRSRRGAESESDSEDGVSDEECNEPQMDPYQRHEKLDHNAGGNQQQKYADHEVVAVTKHQVIPATLRAQLESRPRIHRVLEKSQLNRILLRLYLEKIECDAQLLRRRFRVPSGDRARESSAPLSIAVVRTPLHRFMKEYFLARYEVPALADFHMMEVVKSCLYYHEQLDAILRRDVVFVANALVGCLPSNPENLVRHMQQIHPHSRAITNTSPIPELSQQQQQQFTAADVRVALFSRLCELVPFDEHTRITASASSTTAASGNFSACLLNAVVDVLGDVLELDPAVRSLAQIEEHPNETSWGCPRTLAAELLARHLTFIDQLTMENAKASVLRLSPVALTAELSGGDTDRIAVDVFIALFATAWIRYDQQLEVKLRESFRQQLLLSSPFAKQHWVDPVAVKNSVGSEISGDTYERVSEDVGAGLVGNRINARRSSTVLPAMNSRQSTTTLLPALAATVVTPLSPLEMIAQAWKTLENESLSSLDMEELESTFRNLMEAKQLDLKHRRRPSLKNLHVDTSEFNHSIPGSELSLGGVTEKEFVFHALQVLRRRRNNYGLRTNGKRPHGFTQSANSSTINEDAEVDDLKPGLGSDSLTYVGRKIGDQHDK